jgi:hypothetical protein
MTLWLWWMLAFRQTGTTGDNFAGPRFHVHGHYEREPLYPDKSDYDSRLEIGYSGRLLLTIKTQRSEVMLGLLENQRDHVMGIAAALAKEDVGINSPH